MDESGGRQRSTGCLSSIILHRIFETMSVTDPELTDLGRLMGHEPLQNPPVSPMHPNTEVTDDVATPSFLYGY